MLGEFHSNKETVNYTIMTTGKENCNIILHYSIYKIHTSFCFCFFFPSLGSTSEWN